MSDPENGTLSYTYNADGTLATKHDANGNTETYTYDTLGRLTGIPDRQQTFTYDTCPTTNATGCVNAPGQMVQAAFGSNIGPNWLNFAYNYAYTPAGKVSSKTLAVQSANHFTWSFQYASGAVAASYAYDSQGALTQMSYTPAWYVNNTAVFSYTLDALERPTGLTDNSNNTWAAGATYNAANQMTSNGRQAWTYNNLLQLTGVTGLGMSMTYHYSSTHNNGQITSSVDAITGETITYQYDALKRLQSAAGKNWGETYTYDGYGNLTQMNPSGTAGAPALNVTVALDANGVPTNRIAATGVSYDNNGNQTAGFGGLLMSYDAANRLAAVGGSQSAAYLYDPDNRRIYSRDASGNETIYFYGADGRKLTSYTITFPTVYGLLVLQLNPAANSDGNVYFAGGLIAAEGNLVSTDRLGSVRSGGPGGLGYQAQYPYGAEYTPTVNDREKYATYTRDSVTGLDYAMNRYYSSVWGRFLSPDPYGGSVRLGNPQSWNRYMYTLGDPINRNDQWGYCSDDGSGDDNSGDDSGGDNSQDPNGGTHGNSGSADDGSGAGSGEGGSGGEEGGYIPGEGDDKADAVRRTGGTKMRRMDCNSEPEPPANPTPQPPPDPAPQPPPPACPAGQTLINGVCDVPLPPSAQQVVDQVSQNLSNSSICSVLTNGAWFAGAPAGGANLVNTVSKSASTALPNVGINSLSPISVLGMGAVVQNVTIGLVCRLLTP